MSGDEAALDMFNWKKGKNNMRLTASSLGPQESNCFFIGGKMGKILTENRKRSILVFKLHMSTNDMFGRQLTSISPKPIF